MYIISENDEKGKINFLLKIDMKENDECWVWKGGLDKDGYGLFGVKDNKNDKKYKTRLSHRISFEIFKGEIPLGMMVLHSCDNKSCVNPYHLFLGTHQDNMDDMKSKKRSAQGDKNGQRLHPEKTARGERNGGSKLTEFQVIEIWKLLKERKLNYKDIAQIYNVHYGSIERIKNKKSWKHLTEKLG